jgi:23S rRNA (guanosine2251-2'-O)-methyltransferase
MNYQEKQRTVSKLLTIYGRNAVEEALQDTSLNIYKLHLADSNKKAAVIDNCIRLAEKRNITVEYHDKRQLSFISKNAKQDQGIALDIQLAKLANISELAPQIHRNLILLDNITNPQNVGMIIRSVAAGFIDGLIIPEKGCAELGSLVIKASAGSIFKAAIFRCKNTAEALQKLQGDYQLLGLSLDSEVDFFDHSFSMNTVFILGNESQGISEASLAACQALVKIPMNNQVESLNVAVTAALCAFHPALRR